MAVAEIQSSFAGGELSPQLYARVDLDKFQVGAALLRNFYVDYRGGVSNRGGTEFIADLSNLTGPLRLIPFIVSSQASYVLVFGDDIIRVFSSGIAVVDVVTPYAAADIALLKYSQSADVLTITHPGYPPANLTRTSDTTFVYEVIAVGPIVQPPIITDFVTPHSGAYNFGYLVTSVDLDGKEESLPSNIGVKHCEGMNELTNRVLQLSWTAPDTPVLRYNVYKWGPIDAVTMNPATVWGFIGSSQTVTFSDINIAPDFAKQPPTWGDPFSGGQFQSITVTSGGTGYDGVTGDWTAIPFVPLDISGDGVDAAGYAVIDHANAEIIGAYITNPGRGYTTATITADGEDGTGATFEYTLSDIDPLYPACVSYVQQRRVFAGATLKPETFVMSQPGLYDNFCVTPVALDTDAIGATVASLQVNTIKSLVPVSYGLLAFTSGGCFLISGAGPSQPITPATISANQQASPGANDLPPLQVNYDVVFGAAKGNRILSAGFAWERQSYIVKDVSELAPHLFDGRTTVDWCWAESPNKIIWVVRSDGRLLSLTYVPEEQVYAWARHDTQGLFKSVCSVPELGVDVVYTIVSRHIPNEEGDPCWVTYLERFADRGTCCIFDAWFLDSALTLPSTTADFDVYIEGYTGVGSTVDIYSYDPCGTPSGSFEDAGTTPVITYDSNAIVYAQPEVDGTPEGTPGSLFVDADLNVYTTGTTGWACTTVSGSTLWVLSADDITQLFIDAGAGGDPTFLDSVIGVFLAPGGEYLIYISQASFPQCQYIGIAPISQAVPSLSNWIRFVVPGVSVWGAVQFYNVTGGMVMVTTDFSTTNVQFWMIPSIDDLLGGTFKGMHPGCDGVLDPDQGPTWMISWTIAEAFRDNYDSNLLVQQGTVGHNGIGFSTGGSFYWLAPRAWMSGTDTSGINTTWRGDHPTGGAFRLATGGGGYAFHTWAHLETVQQDLNTSGTEDVTSTLFLDSNGDPALPWTDEYTRILDGGANDGWLASYGGRPAIVQDDSGTPSIFFCILDGNPDYEISIGDGERVYYARVRGYTWDGGAFVQFSEAEGIVLRNGDLGVSNYNFDAPETQHIFVYDDAIYFQIGQYSGMGGAENSGSLLTQFGTITSGITVDTVFTANPLVPGNGCFKIQITEIVDETHLRGIVTHSLDEFLLPDDPDGILQPITTWSFVIPTAIVSGLDHLEGKEVWALADGIVVGPLTVTAGSVELGFEATSVVVGLKYTQQIQTLYLTADGINQGTEQGKRKLLPAVTIRVDCTRGLEVGMSFDALTIVPDLVLAGTTDLFTGDVRTVIDTDWNTKGEICIQQSNPLPATVLGVIPEVLGGDTGR